MPETFRSRSSDFDLGQAATRLKIKMSRTTVLIVDDDSPTRAAYAALLTDCGYDVFEASHGGEAILNVHRHRPAVVLMDLVMPVLDGVETAEALRKFAATADTRILGVTAAWGAARERMRLQCDDLLVKPCSAAEIVDRLQALADRAA